MPAFSDSSLTRLRQCDHRLQGVFDFVIQTFDCTILSGHRGRREQEQAFAAGNSKLRWPDSKHNSVPSMAVDAAPYPIDWDDRERATLFAGYVLGVAAARGIRLRWGGDWDRDTEVRDTEFDDLWHFELIGES